MTIHPPYLFLDTNFLRFIRSKKGASIWLAYLKERRISLSTNLLVSPTLLMEYAGRLPPKNLPQISEPDKEDDLNNWINNIANQCRQYYDNANLSRIVETTLNDLKVKAKGRRRSKPSQEIFEVTHKRWGSIYHLRRLLENLSL